MANIATAYVSIVPSLKGFEKDIKKETGPASERTGGESGKKFMKGFGGGAAGMAKKVLGPIAALFAAKIGVDYFKGAVAGASDLSESASKVGVVFGDSSDQIMAASKNSAKAMGLSQNAYLAATGGLGNLLVSLKIAPDAAAGMSQKMVTLAGDMASFNNASPEETLAAIQSGLTGETEPLKRFGVNMNESTLKAQALKMGLIKTTKEALDPQTKALAAQALILDQTTTAQGDFARTSEGLANQQRIAAAAADDLKAKVGKFLLPVVTTFTKFLTSEVLPAVSGFIEGFQDGTGAGGEFRDVVMSVYKKGLKPTIDFVRDTAIPAIENLIDGFKDGEGPGGVLKDVLKAIYENGIKPLADFITDTAQPAIDDFVQGFKDGEGPGGAFKDVLKDVYKKGLKPLADFITDTALPVLKNIEEWILGPGLTALGDLTAWFTDNKEKIKVFAGVITAVLLPVFVSMATAATTSAATQAAAWVTSKVAGIKSAASQLASHYTTVGGWVLSAGAAVTSGATTAVIWAMLKWDAIIGAASTVASHVAAAGGWATHAAAAVTAGFTTAGVWLRQAAAAAVGAGKVVGSLALVALGWVGTAATATASGVAMAAAWVVGLGPVAWIIAGVVALIAVIVLAYNKVEWFRDGIDEAWQGIQETWDALLIAWDWVVDKFKEGIDKIKSNWDWVVDKFEEGVDNTKDRFEDLKTAFGEVHDFFEGKITAITGFFDGIAETIKGSFKGAFNGIASFWNSTIGKIHFTVPDIIGVPNRGESWTMPQMPYLASGGIITAPTLAMVGEGRESEAVLPLSKLERLINVNSAPSAGSITRDDLFTFAKIIAASVTDGTVRVTTAGIDQAARRAGLDAHAGLGTVVG